MEAIAAKKAPGLAADCEIAARIKEGDRQALIQFVDRHIVRLHNYLLHRLGQGHNETIDKVVESTFKEALRRIEPYARGEATTPMELWLIGLAEKYLAKSRPASSTGGAKTTTAVSETPEEGNRRSPLPEQAGMSDLERLRSAMSAIPNRSRAVLTLSVFEQMTAGDIAQTLGVSPTSAMKRLREALKQLSRVLEQQEKQ
jgi:RNA polymerase sigma factor (sigma-70 family)